MGYLFWWLYWIIALQLMFFGLLNETLAPWFIVFLPLVVFGGLCSMLFLCALAFIYVVGLGK